MVLASLGLQISEAYLRELCDCTFEGTAALKVVDAARRLGFAGTAKHTLTLTDLHNLLAAGIFPIVYVDLRPLEGQHGTHALVVVNLTASSVTVYDPEKGARVFTRQTFTAAWDIQNNLAIIVMA
jgi:ABC-type bacteriocin/lantibiotic exporter with double-glycine peptidase domain